ncbi:MAG: nuclear transport factor 2 family protein [Tunicatimonas sp.]
MTFLKSVILLGFCFVSLCFAQAQSSEDQGAIQSIMDQQVRCWNEGDLDCFMEGYWRSDSLMFIGKSGITYGYDSTLANYQKRYPDRAAMGTLHFDILSLEALSESAYFMVGRWSLQRSIGDLEGYFTLLFRRIDGQWRIVKDHSS